MKMTLEKEYAEKMFAILESKCKGSPLNEWVNIYGDDITALFKRWLKRYGKVLKSQTSLYIPSRRKQ